METMNRGWDKTHIGCGGIVRFVENLNHAHWEWDLECTQCHQLLKEEQVEFKKVR